MTTTSTTPSNVNAPIPGQWDHLGTGRHVFTPAPSTDGYGRPAKGDHVVVVQLNVDRHGEASHTFSCSHAASHAPCISGKVGSDGDAYGPPMDPAHITAVRAAFVDASDPARRAARARAKLDELAAVEAQKRAAADASTSKGAPIVVERRIPHPHASVFEAPEQEVSVIVWREAHRPATWVHHHFTTRSAQNARLGGGYRSPAKWAATAWVNSNGLPLDPSALTEALDAAYAEAVAKLETKGKAA